MVAIDGRRIGPEDHPYIVAELSGNHGGSLERALRIVDMAADVGANAIKLQTYTADTMTISKDADEFRVVDPSSPWNGETLYSLYSKGSTPWEWHEAIFQRARERGISAFSTPFDDSAVNYLEQLDSPCYKIASFEITHLPLIRRVAQTGKPVILSTGMASLAEIDAAVGAARESGCVDLILLKCTSAYPSPASGANIRTIPIMAEAFGCDVGLSDHSLGIGVAVASVAFGAVLIEKHVTLDRHDGAVDSSFSLQPEELEALVEETQRAWQALGKVSFGATDADEESLKYRRSVYIVRDLEPGHILTDTDLGIIRPGYGVEPDLLHLFVGRRLVRSVGRGTALTWDLV